VKLRGCPTCEEQVLVACRKKSMVGPLAQHPMTRKDEAKGLDQEPLCVKCGSKMRFSCTEPEKPGFVHHVYECTRCRSTQSFVTAL
jgi:hypothetical protein